MGHSALLKDLVAGHKALSEEVKALGAQVEDSGRQTRSSLESTAESLRGDSRETRSRANAAAAYADTAVKTVNDLSRDVEHLRDAIATLQRSVDLLAEHCLFAASPSPAAAQSGPDAASPPPPPPCDDREAPAAGGSGGGGGRVPDGEGVGSDDEDGDGPGEGDADGDDGGRGEHEALLVAASTVGDVNLIAHRDAWDFLVQRAAGHEHFGAPAVTDRGDGRVQAVLSGRSLIGLIITLHNTRQNPGDSGTLAMARGFYQRIETDLPGVRRDGTTPMTIRFDDGVTAPGSASPAPAAPVPRTWHEG